MPRNKSDPLSIFVKKKSFYDPVCKSWMFSNYGMTGSRGCQRPRWDAGAMPEGKGGGGVSLGHWGGVQSRPKSSSNFQRLWHLLAFRVQQKTKTFTMKVFFWNICVQPSVLGEINLTSIWYHVKHVKIHFDLFIVPLRKTQSMEISVCRFKFYNLLYIHTDVLSTKCLTHTKKNDQHHLSENLLCAQKHQCINGLFLFIFAVLLRNR